MVFEMEFTAGTDLHKACERLYDEVIRKKETGYTRFNGCTIMICYDCPTCIARPSHEPSPEPSDVPHKTDCQLRVDNTHCGLRWPCKGKSCSEYKKPKTSEDDKK